jgi:hypothetical protein
MLKKNSYKKSMKIIYSSCFSDPWVKIAQKLQQEHGYEPVYWIGYEYDNSKKLVPNAFPNVIYHPYFDAFKGIFPKEIADRFSGSYINIDFLKDYASYELQAIKMMDRMDPDRYSFNFMERQRHFRNLLKYWDACLDYLKPDMVVSERIPHQVFDYVLYLLCKFKKIKFVTFGWSVFPGRYIPLTGISSIGDIFDEEYAGYLKSGLSIKELKANLPDDMIASYEKMKLDYSLAQPHYMKNHLVEHKQSSTFLSLSKKFILDMNRNRQSYFGKDGFLRKGIPYFSKQRRKSIENSTTTVLNYSFLKMNANAYKNKLKKIYDSLAEAPDLNVPYVVFNLHYQPESTSNPSGDIFVDQCLCIDVLAKQIPPNYLIYVKEHSAQFYAHLQGHTSRIPEFYHDLLAYPQVRLMPLHVDPFSLFKYSRAVATITGTSGWEAMVMGKPVINFGLSWYEKYAGVLKVVDEKSAIKITPFIENFKFDERNIFAYLNAFNRKSFKVYAQRGWNDKIKEDKAISIPVFAECIVKMTSK